MTEVAVQSKKNAALCLVRSLKEKKYRREHGLFFVEGSTLFSEAMEAGLVPQTVVLSEGAGASLAAAVRAALEATDARLLVVSESIYESVSAEQAPQGVLAVFSIENALCRSRERAALGAMRYIVLENVQDPGNVGAMLRSAAAFGYRGAMLVNSADVFNPKTVRACMGALFALELSVFDSLEEALSAAKAAGLRLYGTSPYAEVPLQNADFEVPFAMVFGNEGHGMSEAALAACDERLSIPMQGMESLNAACACAVALYESVRQ